MVDAAAKDALRTLLCCCPLAGGTSRLRTFGWMLLQSRRRLNDLPVVWPWTNRIVHSHEGESRRGAEDAGRQGRQPNGATAPRQEPAPVGRWNSCQENKLSQICDAERLSVVGFRLTIDAQAIINHQYSPPHRIAASVPPHPLRLCVRLLVAGVSRCERSRRSYPALARGKS